MQHPPAAPRPRPLPSHQSPAGQPYPPLQICPDPPARSGYTHTHDHYIPGSPQHSPPRSSSRSRLARRFRQILRNSLFRKCRRGTPGGHSALRSVSRLCRKSARLPFPPLYLSLCPYSLLPPDAHSGCLPPAFHPPLPPRHPGYPEG